MSWLDRIGLTRLPFTRPRSLRPTLRSRSLASIARSLEILARAAQIAVAKQWRVDITAPEPSRADRNLDVYEPMYPDDMRDAIREEIDRLRWIEAEMEARPVQNVRADVLRDAQAGWGQRGGVLRMGMVRGNSGAGGDEPLTREEREFLASGLEEFEEEPGK